MLNLKKVMSFLFVIAITIFPFANVFAASAVNIPTYTAQAYHDEAYNLFQQGGQEAIWSKYGKSFLDGQYKIIVNGTVEKIWKDDSATTSFVKDIRMITLVGDVWCLLNEPAATQLVVGQQVSFIGYPSVDNQIRPTLYISLKNGKIYNGEPLLKK